MAKRGYRLFSKDIPNAKQVSRRVTPRSFPAQVAPFLQEKTQKRLRTLSPPDCVLIIVPARFWSRCRKGLRRTPRVNGCTRSVPPRQALKSQSLYVAPEVFQIRVRAPPELSSLLLLLLISFDFVYLVSVPYFGSGVYGPRLGMCSGAILYMAVDVVGAPERLSSLRVCFFCWSLFLPLAPSPEHLWGRGHSTGYTRRCRKHTWYYI